MEVSNNVYNVWLFFLKESWWTLCCIQGYQSISEDLGTGDTCTIKDQFVQCEKGTFFDGGGGASMFSHSDDKSPLWDQVPTEAIWHSKLTFFLNVKIRFYKPFKYKRNQIFLIIWHFLASFNGIIIKASER